MIPPWRCRQGFAVVQLACKADVSNATTLFQVGSEAARSQGRFYEVNPAGPRFLRLRPTGEIVSTPFTGVLNWSADLKKCAEGKRNKR